MGVPKRLYAATATAAIIASISAAAGAAVIYDGGAPDQGGVQFADRNNPDQTEVAVTFQLAIGATTITDVHWWGGCFPGPNCTSPADFVLNFYSDNAGLPGTLIQSFSVGNANQTATGNQIASVFTEYSYSAFIAPLALSAATTYWWGVSNATTPPNASWGLEGTAGPSSASVAVFSQANCGGWCTAVFEESSMAFNLTNDIRAAPEPATLALLGLGLAGLGFSRRKQ